MLHVISGDTISNLDPQGAIDQLEQGAVVFLPTLKFSFHPEEEILYTDRLLRDAKNVSYSARDGSIRGISDHADLAKKMMARYVDFSTQLIHHLFPHYRGALQVARTSFRPAEAYGRKADSYRKDDTRLHVDAFPATPNQGRRLLRVFTNINSEGKPRVWCLGEPFEKVVDYFLARLSLPFPLKKYFLKAFRVTKTLRSDYDDLMLQLHDAMKKDMAYQASVQKQKVEFPAGSTWVVFSDQVSHAALSGQFMLEQTFLLPVEALQTPETAPFKVLEKKLNAKF